jgi:hypothetical protein
MVGLALRSALDAPHQPRVKTMRSVTSFRYSAVMRLLSAVIFTLSGREDHRPCF